MILVLGILSYFAREVDSACCLNCASVSATGCLSCNSGYYLYNSRTCLKDCPTGYTASLGVCVDGNGSKTLFDIDFSLYSELTSSSVSYFKTFANLKFSTSTFQTLMPSKDRGFYCMPSSVLISSVSWLASPDLTYDFWVYPISDGTIAEIIYPGGYLTRINSFNYTVNFRAYNQLTTLLVTKTFNGLPASTLWDLVKIQLSQTTATSVLVKLWLNSVESQYTFTNIEYKAYSPYSWYIGASSIGTAFKGFIYRLRLSLELSQDVLSSISAPACAASKYFDGNSCASCDTTCEWPLCVDSSTCSICNSCQYCKGYTTADCFCDGTSCCQSTCTNCTTFYYCDTCQSGYNNVNGVCEETWTETSVISQNFTGTFLGNYGGFRTGSDETRYFFQNDPETIDPIPIQNRGLYFAFGRYLEYPNLILNSNFSIGLWIKPTSGGVFYKGSQISYINQYFKLEYTDINGSIMTYTTSSHSAFTLWTYVSISVSTGSTVLSLSVYYNSVIYSYDTFPNSVFTDVSSSLILGKTSTSNYQGLIYSIKIWDKTITNFAYEYFDEMCGKSLTSGCLNECSYNQYFKDNCIGCSSTCGLGCVDYRTTCTICQKYLCQYCASFESTTCLQCVDNASGEPCVCDDKYYDSSYICNLCYSRCATCNNGGYICLTCEPTYIYLQGLCLPTCPTGYSSSTSCTLSVETVLALNLNTIIELGSINSFQIGNDPHNIYPDFDTNDPWPMKNRGYYFKNNLSMNTTLLFSPLLSMSIWVKILQSGYILSKSNIIYLQALSSTSYQFMMVLMQGGILSFTKSIVQDSWNYLGFSLTLSSNLYTILYSYLNNVLVSTLYFTGFVSDNSNSPVYVGGTGGFEGFILSMSIYSTSTHYSDSYSLACNDCNTCINCLSACKPLEDPDNSCANCPADCTYGCIDGVCNVCKNHLCITCTDREDSSCVLCTNNSFGADCTCNDGYYADGENCFLCFSRCATCSDAGYFCNSCIAPYYLQAGACVDQCSTGFYIASSQCTWNFTEILDLDLSDAILLGQVSYMQIGSNPTNSYPEYDENDPWPLRDRGYYFSPSSYISGALIFAPEISLSIWVSSYISGEILIKISSDFKFNLTSTETSFIMSISMFSNEISSTVPYLPPSWQCLTVLVDIVAYTSTLQIYSDITALAPVSVNSFISDTSTVFSISSIDSNFAGFVWKLKIWNILSTSISLCGLGPSSSCSNSTYPPDCIMCPSCPHGCDEGICDICPDKLCEVCNSFTADCLKCKSNSTLVLGDCMCDSGFYKDINKCSRCFEECKECIGGGIGECTECFNEMYLIGNVCSICGIGYIADGNKCIVFGDIAFSIDLNNTVLGIANDLVSGIEVITGNSRTFYPDYEETDPYATYLRGYYFNGASSFMNIIDSRFLIPFNCTLDFWLNPTQENGVILHKNSLSLVLTNSVPTLLLNLTAGLITVHCSAIKLQSWSHLLISVKFTGANTIVQCGTILTSPGYFIDRDPQALIGTDNSIYYRGFIYTFTIFTSPITTRRLTTCLDSCDQCLDSGYCIPNCDINYFWVGPTYNSCSTCLASCSQGCRKNDTCNICENEKCNSCTSFNSNTCSSCVIGATDITNCKCPSDSYWNPEKLICFKCAGNEYLYLYSCSPCPDLCSQCTSSSNCLACVENAKLSNSLCYCSIGYTGVTNCTRNILEVSFKVTETNQILITFSQPVPSTLTSSDFSITISISAKWTIEKWSNRQYQLGLEFNKKPTNSSTVEINFKNYEKVVSTTNGTLEEYFYTVNLVEIIDDSKTLMDQAKAIGETVAAAAVSAVLTISVMNPNPACLWSFINTVQMIVFVTLAQVPIGPKSKGLLIGLKNYNFFPNTFAYFVSEGNPHYFQNAYDLGYASDSIIINTGKATTAFIFFMLVWAVLYLLLKWTDKGCCNKNWYISLIKEFNADYKYGFFIRYAITNYIEFEIAALIGLINWREISVYSILNTILCSLILFANVLTPILCLVVVIKRRNRPAQESEQFDSLYGTLFYEFNDDKGLNTSNFYVFFFLKRAVYGLILLLLGDYGILQMSLTITICFAYFLYILMFQPFSEKILNYSNLFSELATLVIFCLVSWLLFEIPETTRNDIDNAIYYTINAIMACQMAASMAVLIKSICDKVKLKLLERKKAKVTPVLSFEGDGLYPNSQDESRLEDARKHNTREILKYNSFFSE